MWWVLVLVLVLVVVVVVVVQKSQKPLAGTSKPLPGMARHRYAYQNLGIWVRNSYLFVLQKRDLHTFQNSGYPFRT